MQNKNNYWLVNNKKFCNANNKVGLISIYLKPGYKKNLSDYNANVIWIKFKSTTNMAKANDYDIISRSWDL